MRAICRDNPINRDHPLNRGLIGNWSVLPGGSGGKTFLNAVGRPNGAFTGDPRFWSKIGRQGGYGSVKFATGVANYVDLGAALPNFNTAEGALAYWVNFASNTQFQNPWAIRTDANNQHECYHGWGGFGINFNYQRTGGGTSVTAATTAVVNQNQWYHVIDAWSESVNEIRVYVDGVSVASAGTIGTYAGAPTINVFGIIQSLAAANAMDGLMDDFRLYNRYPSASEAYALYEESRRGYPEAWNWLGTRTIVFLGGTPPPASTVPPLYHQRQMQGMAA